MYTSDNEEIRENGDVAPTPIQQGDDELQKVKKPGLKLSYEEYKHMANLLVLHMRMVEESATEGKFMDNLLKNKQINCDSIIMTIKITECSVKSNKLICD